MGLGNSEFKKLTSLLGADDFDTVTFYFWASVSTVKSEEEKWASFQFNKQSLQKRKNFGPKREWMNHLSS